MTAGDLGRALIALQRVRIALRPLENTAERRIRVEILVVQLDGAAQIRFTGRGIGIERPPLRLCDLVRGNALLAKSLAIVLHSFARGRELLQRFVPQAAIAAQQAEL